MFSKITPFDIAQHLHTEEEIQLFLKETQAQGTDADFTHAKRTAERERARLSTVPNLNKAPSFLVNAKFQTPKPSVFNTFGVTA